MLLPSVENTNSASVNRQKKSVGSEQSSSSNTQQASNENATPATPSKSAVEKTDDKSAKQQETLQELPENTFATDTPTDNSYPDFTVELSNGKNAPELAAAELLKPDEVRYGRKRPPLPISFSFGLRRPQAVAVAMRHPLIGSQAPSTGAQAILDTLDLAATNRLPYIKGSAINLAA